MPFRVQCPGCATLCQVQEHQIGTQVKCGACGQQFLISAPGSTAPGSGGKLGGLWSGLRGWYQSVTGTKPTEPQPGAPSVPAGSGEVEVGFDLDGPEAAAQQTGSPELAAAAQLTVEPESRHGLFRLELAGATSTGRVRSRNEDSFLIQQVSWSNLDERHEAALVVVADGMGGYEAGDRASHLVIRVLGAALARVWSDLLNPQQTQVTSPDSQKVLEEAIRAANALVHQQGQNPGCKGMGATLATLLIFDGQVTIGHVGDCRVYHLHGSSLQQVTKDQTLVARMIELGNLTEEEARTHQLRNEVTQAIGRRPEVQPAFYAVQLVPGDWLIVACDGLHAHVQADALHEVLTVAPPSSKGVAQHLVNLANAGGGTDNCTVVAVRCY